MDDDTMAIGITQDERGYYWRRAGERHAPLNGPFQTRASAKWDAGACNYLEAGKPGIRFEE